jgi:uncharacterized protein
MRLAAAAALLVAACAAPLSTLSTLSPHSAQCALPFTRAGAIQGRGMATSLDGSTVTTQGVVVADFEGPAPALRGFYLQDLAGDGDPATSDGIFIFNGDRDDVRVGDVVRVTGVAGEAREQTQVAAESIVACGSATVAPTDVVLPVTSATYLERYEGMLVRLPQTLHVTEHYQLGRFGEVVLSSGDRLPQPTSVAQPGAAAIAVQAANDLNRITLADASYEPNPAVIVFARDGAPLSADTTLRGGDQVTGVVGVLTQTAAADAGGSVAYRVRPVNALHGGVPEFVAVNARATTPPSVGGTLRVAAFNLLNYFNTFTGCTAGAGGAPVDCRGAENEAEFERQWRKTVAAVVALDPDILGVIEIENDGYDAASAIAHFVGRLNDATAPVRYAFIDADAGAGQVNALGTDAIKVGIIYRPDRVAPAGRTAVLNTTTFVNGGESAPRSRPSLAQAFEQPDGGTVVVSINHLKSKGGGCDVPDAGDGQGHCNAARTVSARELAAWLSTDPTGSGSSNVLILGDLNAYAREDPLAALAAAGYVDLAERLFRAAADAEVAGAAGGGVAGGGVAGRGVAGGGVAGRGVAGRGVGGVPYSYVFNGQWGSLDYALASASLLPQVTGAAAWHINADEPPVLDFSLRFKSVTQQASLYRPDPFRSSDHDPILVGLRLLPK